MEQASDPKTGVDAAQQYLDSNQGEIKGAYSSFTAAAAVMAFCAIWSLVWTPLGLIWVPANLFGLLRRRSWARISSLLYAAFGLPTCRATPYAIYAFCSLTRPEVREFLDSPD